MQPPPRPHPPRPPEPETRWTPPISPISGSQPRCAGPRPSRVTVGGQEAGNTGSMTSRGLGSEGLGVQKEASEGLQVPGPVSPLLGMACQGSPAPSGGTQLSPRLTGHSVATPVPLTLPGRCVAGAAWACQKLPVELGEVQLFRLRVPGGTTRGQERGRVPLVMEMRRPRHPGEAPGGEAAPERGGQEGEAPTGHRQGQAGTPHSSSEPGTSAMCSQDHGAGPALQAFPFFNHLY